jgi:hypothetical protein
MRPSIASLTSAAQGSRGSPARRRCGPRRCLACPNDPRTKGLHRHVGRQNHTHRAARDPTVIQTEASEPTLSPRALV